MACARGISPRGLRGSAGRTSSMSRRGAGGGLDAGLGHARDRRLRAALGAGARGTAVRVPARGRRPGERRRRCCARRGRSARAAWRSVRVAPIRMGRRPCGRAWARSSTVALARVESVAELPGERVALVATRAPRPAPGGTAAPVYAARGRRARGATGGGRGGVRAHGAHPDRGRVAERRDGRDGGAVRDDRRGSRRNRVRAK